MWNNRMKKNWHVDDIWDDLAKFIDDFLIVDEIIGLILTKIEIDNDFVWWRFKSLNKIDRSLIYLIENLKGKF